MLLEDTLSEFDEVSIFVLEWKQSQSFPKVLNEYVFWWKVNFSLSLDRKAIITFWQILLNSVPHAISLILYLLSELQQCIFSTQLDVSTYVIFFSVTIINICWYFKYYKKFNFVNIFRENHVKNLLSIQQKQYCPNFWVRWYLYV